MKQLYNWDTNILQYENKNNNKFYFELRGNKNVIRGCSGTGKTFLFNEIDKLRRKGTESIGIDVSNIVTLTEDNLHMLRELKSKLIIIDSADLILTPEDTNYIDMDDNNRYLLFSRIPLGIDLSPNHFGQLINDNGITKIEYFFNVKGWY